jgi:hypothetical protein
MAGRSGLEGRLSGALEGEVRFDAFLRGRYTTRRLALPGDAVRLISTSS